jgi:uncharacterized protein (TIGR03643 family)
MDDKLRNTVIRMAWEDCTTFDEIHKKTGLAEADVIRVMRASLKAGSFRMWRKRVSGRITKHAGKFRESRLQMKRVSRRDLLNQQESE